MNCVLSIINSSNRIIFSLNLATEAFSFAMGLFDISFMKNARASLSSILLKRLNPTSFLILSKISEII